MQRVASRGTTTSIPDNCHCYTGAQEARIGSSEHEEPSANFQPLLHVQDRGKSRRAAAFGIPFCEWITSYAGIRKHHSTESGLLRVLSGILSSVDKGQISLLDLLDVSAAFNTVDHSILFDRLSISFGLTGSAFDWMQSFIVDRTQTVYYCGSVSRCAVVRSGAAQGSVLGPLLYVLYTTDIQRLVVSLGFSLYLYADNTQFHGSCKPADAADLAARALDVINSIKTWMSSNRLRLKADKTQLQSVLNSAARLVLKIPKFSNISAAIRDELYWLPIRRRIDFKIALMVRHCLVGAAPEYLMELCHPFGSAFGRQCLRSASRGDLVVPRFRLQTFSHRAFAVSGPQIWNSLPLRIRQSRDNLLRFKQKLKAHLFQQF